MTFEEAVATLPIEASPAVELSWIRSHPAMARQERSPDRGKPILLTAEDILSPPNGCAPSRSAAHELQHWVNSPEEFWKKGYDERRKKQAVTGTGATEIMQDIEEIRRLLQQVDGRRPVADKRERERRRRERQREKIEATAAAEDAMWAMAPERMKRDA